MGGGFTTGFLGAVGDAAKKRADERRSQLDAQKAQQADIYWGVIKSADDKVTDEQRAYARQQLEKLYPKDPQIKQLFEKFHGLLQQVHGGKTPQTGPNAPLEGGGIPPPPQPAQAGAMEGAPGTPPQARGIPPPPQPAPSATPAAPAAAATPKGQDPRFAEMAKRAAGPTPAEEDERKFQLFKRQQTLIKDFNIEEEQAKAKATADAKAANPTGRPVMGPAVSVFNAKRLASQGKSFLDEDGDPIDLSSLPDSMGLKFVAWGGKHYYIPFSPNEKVLTVGNETYAVNPMDVEALLAGGGTDLGQHLMPSTTSTVDPATGQTTTARHVPTTTGVRTFSGGAAQTPPKAAPATAPGVAPGKTPPIAKSTPSTGTPSMAPSAAPTTPDTAAQRGLPPLDADGHVPASAPVASPQVREGANQLLDGQDVNKLPSKTRDLSANLARQYGWEQGKFTPKEQTMLREATTFIDEALSNPALSALDDDPNLDEIGNFYQRQKLAQVLDSVDKHGMISRGITSAMAKNLTDNQVEYKNLYNQLVGTISGLTPLTRTSRATEQTINRLIRELPNPLTTRDSADGIKQLQRLRREIDVAMKKGTFIGVTGNELRKSPISTPPKPASSGTKPMSSQAQQFLESYGIPR